MVAFSLWVLAAAWWRGRRPILRTPADPALAAFTLGAAASTALGLAPLLSLFGPPQRHDGLVPLLVFVLLGWVVAQVATTGERAGRIQLAIVGGAYVASILAVLDVARNAAETVGAGETAFTFAGLLRAAGPLGNPNVLGAVLAIAIPLAVGRLALATDTSARIGLANVIAVLGLALALTFSRSAWIGVVVGGAVVLWPSVRWRSVGVVALELAAMGVALSVAASREVPVAVALTSRAGALADPGGSFGTRAHIWAESIEIVRAHPVLGVGPGAFGLAYPEVQRGDWAGGALVDKAHAELLDVAATQGIVGVVTYLAVLAVLLRAAFAGSARGPRGAVVGYLVTLLVNFTTVPAAIPFWILAGTILGPASRPAAVAVPRVIGTAAAVLALALVLNATRAVAAEAIAAGGPPDPEAFERAGALVPERTDIAELAGDVARAQGDLASARAQYERAARVGTAEPSLHWKLALIYRDLAMPDQALREASVAVRLHPFDPRNDALLCEVAASCR